MKKLIYLLTIGVSLTWVGCGSKKESDAPAEGINVTLTQVTEQLSPETFKFSGRFMTDHSVDLSTKLTGTIQYLPVSEGDAVKQGQVLAKISSADIQARQQQAYANLAEAKAQLKSVEKDFGRIEKLHQSGSATEKEFDDMNYQLSASKAKVSAIENAIIELDELLGYAQIRAPFNGFVTKKFVEEGHMATPGSPILTVESGAQLKVVAKIPESELSYVKTGDTVALKSESAGVKTQGVVSHINPSSLAGNLQFEATIQLTEPLRALKSGMYAEIESKKNLRKKVLVEKEAVFHQGQLTGVYTINNQNKTSIRWIRLGKSDGDKVEVLSGLTPGETIVLKSPAKLQSGLAVNVSQSSN